MCLSSLQAVGGRRRRQCPAQARLDASHGGGDQQKLQVRLPQRSPSISHVTATPHSPKVTRRISIYFGAVLGCVMELNPRDRFPMTDGGRFCQPSKVTVPFHSRLWPLLCPLTLRCHRGSALCHPRHPKSLPRPSEPVGPSLALSCLAFLKQKG